MTVVMILTKNVFFAICYYLQHAPVQALHLQLQCLSAEFKGLGLGKFIWCDVCMYGVRVPYSTVGARNCWNPLLTINTHSYLYPEPETPPSTSSGSADSSSGLTVPPHPTQGTRGKRTRTPCSRNYWNPLLM